MTKVSNSKSCGGICGPRERLRSHSEKWGSSSDQRAGVSPSSFPGLFLQSSPFPNASLLQSEFLLPVYKYPQVPPILKSPSGASPPPSSPVLLLLSVALPRSLPLQQNFLKALPPKPPLPPGKAAQRLFPPQPPPHPHGWAGSLPGLPPGRVCVCVCVCVCV